MIKILYLLFFISISCWSQDQKKTIEETLNNWHQAAAEANFNNYFDLMTSNAVFIGTDASENWQLDEFKKYAKPYFENGKAWTFNSLEKNIYFSKNKKIAWFDELLETDLGICRGSGIMKLTKNGWKIAHYVLSITIPNENLIKIKTINKPHDYSLLKILK
ncbi:nuclear transport factor 2 family protein [Mesonia aestuariivivens]|uniref:Nuclear transport factor 2 family protein n=1 Tax=Mesonia aestuariivivens TaxID=2796128 RepID=A0ABS6W251_9FLAO|nr:nuclear transport factor 2 family protein [Mesonia aestuariivivens]MBW2961912.1 nuclear transport factor 2 family protein [Mesonia aestuariivivens]